VKKIDSLTDEQKAKFPEYVKRWTAFGLSTLPADRPMAEKGIELIYASAGEPKPEKIVWCSSPMDAIKKIKEVQDGDSSNVQVSAWGQHDASASSYFAFFRDELGLTKETEKWQGFDLLSRSAGWLYAFKGIAFVCERTSVVKKDEQGQLHCETGPACAFPDGWGVYCWHGVRVPKWVIEEPHKLTAELCLKEDNQEVRRCMIEKMGTRRFIIESKGEVLDHDSHDINWDRALLKIGWDKWFFVCDPSTKRNYPIQVSEDCETCEDADRWMNHGYKTWDGETYKQVSRT